ncbi:hypothetical protein ZIOFF_055541 [Zingiber officinale]|uniref:Uncharacterized protein n=1 Tax=Zingiber officinale TaxID=94328 RepID=A0A8J5FGM2_ZINOF|nr:hypothetical protein ZIOFF_055541 [Zingiber officinale]
MTAFSFGVFSLNRDGSFSFGGVPLKEKSADSANIKSASGGQIVANSKAHMAKVVLKEHLVLTLFRDEYDLLHEDYQLFLLPSILESKKLAKSRRAKQKYADLEYNVAKQVEKMISNIKALVAVRGRIFSAHQDGHIRVRQFCPCGVGGSENTFQLTVTLPTARDRLGKILM